jgi:hypothetical protein
MLIQIKNRFTGNVLFEYKSENNTIKETVIQANLRSADLRSADLSVIKNDMFVVLLNGINEIKHLKQSLIDGKIDGSVYDGECACLNGTLCQTAYNGEKDRLISIRDSARPIERFFLGISKGNTPENSQFSALALKWINEFEMLINSKVN